MVAVVTLLRVLARMSSGGSKLSNVRSFITWRSGEGVTTFTKGKGANFSSENGKMKLCFENTLKNFKDKSRTSSCPRP